MNTEELVQDNNVDIGICDECSGEIHCNKENVYIEVVVHSLSVRMEMCNSTRRIKSDYCGIVSLE